MAIFNSNNKEYYTHGNYVWTYLTYICMIFMRE